MAPTQNSKSAAMNRPRVASPIQYELDILRGLCRSTKVGCLVFGILCFGFMFVTSLLLVVSGVAALWLGNNNDNSNSALEDDKTPSFLEDPFDTAGIVMLLTGVGMLVGLLCLWCTAERRSHSLQTKTGRVINALPSAPISSGTYISGSNSCASSEVETPTAGDRIVGLPLGSFPPRYDYRFDLRHLTALGTPPGSIENLVSFPGEPSEGQMSYPSAPSESRMSYPVPSSERQMSYLVQPPGGQMSYSPAPSGDQMSYFVEPSRDQMSYPVRPSGRQMSYLVEPSGGQMSYSVAPTGRQISYTEAHCESQMSYPVTPSGGQSQYTRPAVGQMVPYPGQSLPLPRQYLPSGQVYQPQAHPLERMTTGLPSKSSLPNDVDIDFAGELPPPYTP